MQFSVLFWLIPRSTEKILDSFLNFYISSLRVLCDVNALTLWRRHTHCYSEAIPSEQRTRGTPWCPDHDQTPQSWPAGRWCWRWRQAYAESFWLLSAPPTGIKQHLVLKNQHKAPNKLWSNNERYKIHPLSSKIKVKWHLLLKFHR